MSYTPLNDIQKVAGNPISVDAGNHDSGTIRVVVATNQPPVDVNITGGSSGNAAAGPTGSPVPADADFVGFDSSGNLVGVSSANPLPVAVISGGGSNASVSITGAAAPGSATEIGLIDFSSGHLVGASSDVRGSKNVLAVEIVDAAGNQITSFGSSSVNVTGIQSVVSAANSSTTPLTGSASFTGTAVDLVATPGYITIQVQSFSDVSGTLQIQFSTDNTNWDHVVTATAPAGNPTSVANGIHARFVRVVYVNGSSAQSTFRLQTVLIPGAISPTIKDLETAFDVNDNALATHAVITGKTTAGGGSYVDVKVNPSGSLQVGGSLNNEISPGTSAPSDIAIVGGKSNDGTPQYQPIPLGAGGRSVIIEGFSGGTAVVVSGNKTHNTAAPTTDNIGALVAVASTAAPTYNNGDQVLLSTDLTGNLRVNATFTGTLSSQISYSNPTTATLLKADINFSTAGDHTIVAAVGGQTIRIMRMLLVIGGTQANTITFKDSTPTTLLPGIPLTPYQGIALDLDAEPYYITASGKAFVINAALDAQVSGTVWYTQS